MEGRSSAVLDCMYVWGQQAEEGHIASKCTSTLSSVAVHSLQLVAPQQPPTLTVMYVMSARFLTRPTAWPSGVSAGHIMPHRL